MLEIRSRRDALEALKANPLEKEIAFKIRPTTQLLTLVLTHTQAQTVYCSLKMKEFFTPKMVSALEQVGVRVKAIETRMGRPRTRTNEKLGRIKTLHAQGKKPEGISKRLRIPLRTVYYYLNGK